MICRTSGSLIGEMKVLSPDVFNLYFMTTFIKSFVTVVLGRFEPCFAATIDSGLIEAYGPLCGVRGSRDLHADSRMDSVLDLFPLSFYLQAMVYLTRSSLQN